MGPVFPEDLFWRARRTPRLCCFIGVIITVILWVGC
jgi:hypothetical protein